MHPVAFATAYPLLTDFYMSDFTLISVMEGYGLTH